MDGETPASRRSAPANHDDDGRRVVIISHFPIGSLRPLRKGGVDQLEADRVIQRRVIRPIGPRSKA